ncbi:hypothetical protein GPALN_006642 [Globodera pallida]|nr:hypothetical protein GPALN_006642 [Globodera pallida]
MIEHGLPEDRERIVRSLQGDIMKNAHENRSWRFSSVGSKKSYGTSKVPGAQTAGPKRPTLRTGPGPALKWFNKFKLFVWRFCITAAKMYPRVRLSRDPSGVGIGGQSVTN